MCDLWRYTTAADTPRGAIPAQIAAARERLRERTSDITQIKLYNAGSFFDPRAVPEEDYEASRPQLPDSIASIVESHPALIGARVDRFLDALDRHAAASGAPPRLEVAMGLETVHPDALERLHKRMTVDQFVGAADGCDERDVALRVFLLIAPPFVPPDEQDAWLLESIDVAFALRRIRGDVDSHARRQRRDGGAVRRRRLSRSRASTTSNAAFRASSPSQPRPRRRTPTLGGRPTLRRPLGSGTVLRLPGLFRRAARPAPRHESRAADSARRCRRVSAVRRIVTQPPPTSLANILERATARRADATSRPGCSRASPASYGRPCRSDVDIAIVGSGFAGSLTALACAALGCSVALVERGRHPRFAIGESSTPLANLLLEQIADRYDLPRIRVVLEMGHLAAGAARGRRRPQTRLHLPVPSSGRAVRRRSRPRAPVAGRRQPARRHRRHALVPAGLRPRLVREAEAAGAIYLDETELTGIEHARRSRRRSRARVTAAVFASPRRSSSTPAVRADFSLARSASKRRRCTGCRRRRGSTRTSTDVERWDRSSAEARRGTPPLPAGSAALHHVFPGGWMWVLRFNNGITSAGRRADRRGAASIRAEKARPPGSESSRGCRRFANSFAARAPCAPFVHAPRIAFRTRQVCGPGWALLAVGCRRDRSAAVHRLPADAPRHRTPARRAGAHRGGTGARGRAAALRAGHARTNSTRPNDWSRRSTRAWPTPPLFKRLTLLYFAAASYAKRPGASTGPSWRPASCSMPTRASVPSCARARARRGTPGEPRATALLDRIDRAIEPFDIAGLLDRTRRDWYPVLADDLIANAFKLNATTGEVVQLLERCGFDSATANQRVYAEPFKPAAVVLLALQACPEPRTG